MHDLLVLKRTLLHYIIFEEWQVTNNGDTLKLIEKHFIPLSTDVKMSSNNVYRVLFPSILKVVLASTNC